jgi:hypothetical protein
MRALVGILLGVLARVWLATLRVRLVVHPELAQCADVPWVLSFFHGTQWPLLAWKRRRPTLVMVSHSADGAIQARALGMLGFLVVRGSSSRGGARALSTIVRRMRKNPVDAAFAVDGPRGPYGDVKPGAALAAQRSGGVLVPMGSAAAHGKVFGRAWDRFVLAWPFSRVVVVLGAPVAAEGLGAAIEEANARAAEVLAMPGERTGSGKELSGHLNREGGSPVQYRGSPYAAPGAPPRSG